MRSSVSTTLSRIMFLVFSMILFASTGCGRGSTVLTGSVTGSSPGAAAATEVTSLYALINADRAYRGMSSLALNTTMQSVAQQYSDEIAIPSPATYNFAINNLDAQTRLRNAGLSFSNLGHQGAIDYTTAATLHAALINSNSFVLTGTYSKIGIAVKSGTGHNYWTILVSD